MKEFLYFLIYSLVGWIYETILCSVRERRFVNRGFLNGPYCPIYGCGALIDIFLLRPFTNPVVIFFSSMVLCSILEYITSYLMEKIFKARWWDYSNMKFNINGRVCLLGALVFGAMSLLLVKFLHPLVVRLVDMIPPLALKIAVPVLAAGFIADFVVTVIGLSGLNARLREFNAMVKAELENTSFAANSREIGKKLNINTDLSYFSLINPCGFTDKGATSLARELGGEVDFERCKAELRQIFEELFG